jgi:alpha-tubulin suppressor-like RCC1 family protein
MNSNRQSRLIVLGACIVVLSLTGQAAPGMAIAPSNPTISIGQTQPFTATGTITTAGVSAGGEYTCLRLADGTAQCTGRNQFGQLANGTFNNSSNLTPVNGITTAASVAAGDEFGCAVLAGGTVNCWGLGESGQRGDGSTSTFAANPVPVSGITTAVAIAAGYDHACALLADGTMRCWGSNVDGQLGSPSTPQSGSAVPVTVEGIAGAVAVATGAYHTCALLQDSTLRCWGRNDQAQLGNGTRTSSASPVQVNGITGAVAVSGGGVHTCAVLRDGTAWCWGENEFGQLGDGTTNTASYPVQVIGLTTAVGVSAGWRHACAALAAGSVRCWGQNEFGQLGDGTVTSSSTPRATRGIANATAVTGGWWHHSCALLADGTVQCWGTNDWGQFGNGTTTSSTSPVTMSGTGVLWTSSNVGVATIDAAGRATGIGAGTTTITATDQSGASASSVLTVRQPPQPVVLTVNKSGVANGQGTVTSSPQGISCGSDCSAPYAIDTLVTLTASPAALLSSWSGCDSVSGATCTVAMSSARSVTATFAGMPF